MIDVAKAGRLRNVCVGGFLLVMLACLLWRHQHLQLSPSGHARSASDNQYCGPAHNEQLAAKLDNDATGRANGIRSC